MNRKKRRTATLKQWVETQASVLTWERCNGSHRKPSLQPESRAKLAKIFFIIEVYLWQYAGYMLGSKSIADKQTIIIFDFFASGVANLVNDG